MKILRAEHLGMCFGVKDAIELALETAAHQPLTILGDLVHNEAVLDRLRAGGIQLRNEPGEVGTQTVMVTAHGASERRLSAVRGRGLDVLEATCPLVQAAHRAVAELVREGFHPVIIGKREHVEVHGLTEDLPEFDVVLTEDDVLQLQGHARFGIAAQTTQPIAQVRRLVALIRQRFPKADVRFVDTVCQPTKLRQHAALELAQRCDVVVVIGGAHSNNTHELVKTCSRYCARVHHVQTAEQLRHEWFTSTDTVGITAGTSTPDTLISEVEAWLRNVGWHEPRAVGDSSEQAVRECYALAGNARGHFSRWFTVVLFAAAMAWVESAVVFYLRTHLDRLEPYQPNPLPMIGALGPVEMARELTTLIMLFTVGVLAGRTWRARVGYMAVAFGVWDICYYAFLKVMCGWPQSLLDWDILFLLPLPWWGPVLAPVLIAALMVLWGTLASQFERPRLPAPANWHAWLLNFIGMALGLYVFMADALRASGGGVEALRNLLPTAFNWPLFGVALAFMAAPVVKLARELWAERAPACEAIHHVGRVDGRVAPGESVLCEPLGEVPALRGANSSATTRQQ